MEAFEKWYKKDGDFGYVVQKAAWKAALEWQQTLQREVAISEIEGWDEVIDHINRRVRKELESIKPSRREV